MLAARPSSAYDLFRIGHDTLAIAQILRITEPEAFERVSIERSARLGLEDPYMPRPARRPKDWPTKRLAYAGREY